MRKLFVILCLAAVVPCAWATWTFTEINYATGTDAVSDIEWRPQGDYAILTSYGLMWRYNYVAQTLEYQIVSGVSLGNITWSPDGSYALIAANTSMYRYEHAETGFGTLTEITDIQKGNVQDTVKFYDIEWNPASPDDPPYISTNYKTNSSSQSGIRMYRYDPMAAYDLMYDFSGGTTFASSSEYQPLSISFQADGDYLVCSSYMEVIIYVYDPDQSTFPKLGSGSMQYFDYGGNLGNSTIVEMCPRPGTRFGLVKGSTHIRRITEEGIPPVMAFDDPGGPDMIFGGDVEYCSSGMRALGMERQTWDPHRMAYHDEWGTHMDPGINVTVPNRTERLYEVAWHPNNASGLLGGADRWMIRFDTDEVPPGPVTPTPTPVLSPVPTDTPAPHDVPAAGIGGIALMLLILGAGLVITTHHRR